MVAINYNQKNRKYYEQEYCYFWKRETRERKKTKCCSPSVTFVIITCELHELWLQLHVIVNNVFVGWLDDIVYDAIH